MEAILPATADFAEMFDAGTADDLSIQPFEEPYDDDVAELMSPTMPEQWDLNEKYVETSILRLNIAMIKSGIRATEIDTRLRTCRGHSDHETIETCLRLLREDCISYLAEQSEAAEKFSARISELGELSSLGEEIEMTNLEQSAQVETTINNLEYMDFRSDPEAANQRLLEEIKNLRSCAAQAARQSRSGVHRHRPVREPHRQDRKAALHRPADEAPQPHRLGRDAQRMVETRAAEIPSDVVRPVRRRPVRPSQRTTRPDDLRPGAVSPRTASAIVGRQGRSGRETFRPAILRRALGRRPAGGFEEHRTHAADHRKGHVPLRRQETPIAPSAACSWRSSPATNIIPFWNAWKKP